MMQPQIKQTLYGTSTDLRFALKSVQEEEMSGVCILIRKKHLKVKIFSNSKTKVLVRKLKICWILENESSQSHLLHSSN